MFFLMILMVAFSFNIRVFSLDQSTLKGPRLLELTKPGAYSNKNSVLVSILYPDNPLFADNLALKSKQGSIEDLYQEKYDFVLAADRNKAILQIKGILSRSGLWPIDESLIMAYLEQTSLIIKTRAMTWLDLYNLADYIIKKENLFNTQADLNVAHIEEQLMILGQKYQDLINLDLNAKSKLLTELDLLALFKLANAKNRILEFLANENYTNLVHIEQVLERLGFSYEQLVLRSYRDKIAELEFLSYRDWIY